ncbi:MAG TPA: hypothetical protein VFB24_10330 [Candidatus Binatia bacterium]|nr:hypothetical protein [Candidatus Binatia bacterium]
MRESFARLDCSGSMLVIVESGPEKTRLKALAALIVLCRELPFRAGNFAGRRIPQPDRYFRIAVAHRSSLELAYGGDGLRVLGGGIARVAAIRSWLVTK